MLVQAKVRLKDGGVGQLLVDLPDAPIFAAVAPAIDTNRPIDAMHQPATGAPEAAQAISIKVKRVKQTSLCHRRNGIVLYPPAPLCKLLPQPAQELMAAARRGRGELVKDRHIRRLGSALPEGHARSRLALGAP